MKELIESQTPIVTMSSKEIAKLLGKEHKNVIRDIRAMIDELYEDGSNLSHVVEIKDSRGYTREFKLDRRHSEILVTGYDVKRRAAVIDRWFELEIQEHIAPPQPKASIPALEYARFIREVLPNLSESSMQTMISKASEIDFGIALIPLPKVEENLLNATKVGALLGISANKVGRLANTHEIKTNEYGEWRLDKSKHSSKQVESFYYNEAGIERLRQLLEAKAA